MDLCFPWRERFNQKQFSFCLSGEFLLDCGKEAKYPVKTLASFLVYVQHSNSVLARSSISYFRTIKQT